MKITILTVGDRPPKNLADESTHWLKRLPSTITVNWHYIPNQPGDKTSRLRSEGNLLLAKIPANTTVFVLDEHGAQFTSPAFSNKVFATQKDCCFIIGGAYGVSDEVKARADIVWSLSPLVFPHQLVRLVLAEQLYRAHTIYTAHPYHH